MEKEHKLHKPNSPPTKPEVWKESSWAREIKIGRDNHNIRLSARILPMLPRLLFRSGGALLRFRMDAKKGTRIFQRELIDRGIDKKIADDLAELYLEGSDLLHYFHQRK